MALNIEKLTLGPYGTNTYLIADSETQTALVIDPAARGERILGILENRHLALTHILITHAHFDHVGGVNGLMDGKDNRNKIYLHQDDLAIWNVQGGASVFGVSIDNLPRPTNLINEERSIQFGTQNILIYHTPGHTPGHVVYHIPSIQSVFCGDLIFNYGVGRTDLPGGSYTDLMESIKSKIFTLPDETRLLPGHGPETTVKEEKKNNPFFG